MSTQVQFRRGTATQNNSFTGALGEITIDTDNKSLRIHDGTTPGGSAVPTLNGTQTFTNKTFGSGSTWNGNAVGVGYGGTGASLTATAGAIVYSGASTFGLTSAGTSGQVLSSAGSSAPVWLSQSALTVGNATQATYSTNLSGGSAGQLAYQTASNTTGFITAGASGTFLQSTGAGTAPTWAAGQVTYGSTTVALGATSTTLQGLTLIDTTTGATSVFPSTLAPVLFGSSQNITIGNNTYGSISSSTTFAYPTGTAVTAASTYSGVSQASTTGNGSGATFNVVKSGSGTYYAANFVGGSATISNLQAQTGSGPWTATLTGLTSTAGFVVGAPISATNGTGTLAGGTPTSVVVTSIVNGTSITYTQTGGTTPIVGTVTAVTQTGNTTITYNSGSVGSGYAVGDSITIAGASLGGATPANNLTFTLATAIQPIYGTVNLNAATVTTANTTFTFANTTATTINAFGAATTISLGASTGKTTINSTDDSTSTTTGAVTVAGGMSVAKAVNFGTKLFLGSGAYTVGQSLNNPTAVIKASGSNYVQTSLVNATSTGSSDYIAYGDNYPGYATADHGWVDMGFTGSGFNDSNFTITGKNDGYVFASAVSGTGLTGNLVLATDSTGTTNDIVLGTGGFLAANEQWRFVNSTGALQFKTPTITSSTGTTANVFNTTVTTGNLFGTATNITVGANSGTFTHGNPTIVGTQAVQNLFNTVATTLNIGGAATVISLGASTGKTTINSTDNATSTGTGAFVISGGLGIAKDVWIGGNLNVAGTVNQTSSTSLTVNDQYLYLANNNTGNLLDTGMVQVFNDGTHKHAGLVRVASTGNYRLFSGATNEPGATVDFTNAVDANLQVGSLLTSTTTFNLVNTGATTLNIGGAATTISLGSSSSATLTINPGTIVGANSTQTLFNTVATTVNAFGAATSITLGNATSATLTLNPGTIVGSNTVQNVFNTVATTVNAFGAAGTLILGASSGTASIANPTVTLTNATALNINGASPVIATTSTTASVFNTTVTTLNIGGAATTLNLGASGGTTTVSGHIKLEGVTSTGATGTGNLVFASSPSVSNLTITGTLTAGGSAGTSGYLLQSTGTGVQWASATISLAGTSGTGSVSTGGTLTFAGSNGFTATVSGSTITLADPQNLQTSASTVQFASLGIGTTASGTTGEIRATATITSYYSDERLKTRIGNIQNALAKVLSLDGFHYTANETAQALGYDGTKQEVGLSAQQVQAVLPEVVAPAPIDEQYLTIHYDRVIPLLVEAIKEQQNQIQELKELVARLGK